MDDTGGEIGIERISAAMARFRVMIGRRVISRLALANVAPGLELSDLDVLGLVPQRPGKPACGLQPKGEVSVGDIARQLRIDPSRASRLVAGLVEQGYLTRAVSQEDARRAVLQRSDAGDRIFAEIRRVKLELIRQTVGDWPEAKLAAFAESFDEFTSALDAALSAPEACQA